MQKQASKFSSCADQWPNSPVVCQEEGGQREENWPFRADHGGEVSRRSGLERLVLQGHLVALPFALPVDPFASKAEAHKGLMWNVRKSLVYKTNVFSPQIKPPSSSSSKGLAGLLPLPHICCSAPALKIAARISPPRRRLLLPPPPPPPFPPPPLLPHQAGFPLKACLL